MAIGKMTTKKVIQELLKIAKKYEDVLLLSRTDGNLNDVIAQYYVATGCSATFRFYTTRNIPLQFELDITNLAKEAGVNFAISKTCLKPEINKDDIVLFTRLKGKIK